tara:strand:+ start:590 stop:772 length:183 start_codon:yes stop_codon:yes gene_type:complete
MGLGSLMRRVDMNLSSGIVLVLVSRLNQIGIRRGLSGGMNDVPTLVRDECVERKFESLQE